MSREIAERSRQGEALRQREAQLRAVLDSAVDSIITIDGRGIIRSVNPATERMFGYTAQELVGPSDDKLLGSEHQLHWTFNGVAVLTTSVSIRPWGAPQQLG